MKTLNIVLFCASIVFIGAIRYFEGWKSFFKAAGLWVVALALLGMTIEALELDRDSAVGLVGVMIVLIFLNLGYFLYLLKKGYLKSIIF